MLYILPENRRGNISQLASYGQHCRNKTRQKYYKKTKLQTSTLSEHRHKNTLKLFGKLHLVIYINRVIHHKQQRIFPGMQTCINTQKSINVGQHQKD